MSGPAAAPGDPAGKRADSLDLLELCGGCGERLRAEKAPRLLPCLHSVCRECLRTAPGPAGAAAGGPVVDCPVCQHPCPLAEVVENYFLRDTRVEAAAVEQGPSQCCTSCEDEALATSYCVECSEPLCDTCVEAHQRVKYTRDHTVRALGLAKAPGGTGAIPCPVHPQEPLALFCDTCDTLTCRHCQQLSHGEHRSQRLEEAVRSQRQLLAPLVQRLGERHADLQRVTHHLRGLIRRVSDVQKRVQVEVKMAVLQVMRELNRRARVLVSDAQRMTEGRQEQLERQHRAMTRLQRHQEHVLRFASRALESGDGSALLLSTKLIHVQLHHALKAIVDPVEPQSDMTFQWDLHAWTRSAETFGTIIVEQNLNPQPAATSPHGPSPASQGLPEAAVVSRGQCIPPPLLCPSPAPSPPRGGREEEEGQRTPSHHPAHPDVGEGSGSSLPLPQFPLECRDLGPPQLYPQSPEEALANGLPEAAAGVKRRIPLTHLGEGEKLVEKPLVKRSAPTPGAAATLPPLRKVPRVSLERLDLDLSAASHPPVFRVFPGASARDFSLIVIEGGGQRRLPLTIKEEQEEAAISAPPRALPGPLPAGLPGPPGSSLGSGSTAPTVSCCRVCCRAGAVVMCDHCERCYHLDCHLPPLHEVPRYPNPCGIQCGCLQLPPALDPGHLGAPGPNPGTGGGVALPHSPTSESEVGRVGPFSGSLHLIPSPEWRCLLCQELPPPGEDPPAEEGPPHRLSPHDQQRCEFVLLSLLCHEPCRPLHCLASAPEGAGAALDLTLIRAKLQEKLSPPYGCPQEFARDVWRVIRQSSRRAEDKAELRPLLDLQRFLEARLSAAFGDRKFPSGLFFPPPLSPRGEAEGSAAP